jgi:hypothetical protein
MPWGGDYFCSSASFCFPLRMSSEYTRLRSSLAGQALANAAMLRVPVTAVRFADITASSP